MFQLKSGTLLGHLILGALGKDRAFGRTRIATLIEKSRASWKSMGICRVAESLGETVRRNRVL